MYIHTLMHIYERLLIDGDFTYTQTKIHTHENKRESKVTHTYILTHRHETNQSINRQQATLTQAHIHRRRQSVIGVATRRSSKHVYMHKCIKYVYKTLRSK